MKNLRRPLRWLAGVLVGLGLSAAVSAAPAIVLIDGTNDGLLPDPGLANVAFSLVYEDSDANGLFSLGELLVFGGFSDSTGFFDQLLAVPDTALTLASSAANEWRFGDGTNEVAFGAARFTPFATPLQNAMPVAGSGSLVAAALLAVALAPRRRRAAAR